MEDMRVPDSSISPEQHAGELLASLGVPADRLQPGSAAVRSVTALVHRPTVFSVSLDRFGRRDESAEDEAELGEPALLRIARGTAPDTVRPLAPALHITHDIDRLTRPPRTEWPRMAKLRWKLLLRGRFAQAAALAKELRWAKSAGREGGMAEMLAAGDGVPRTVFVADAFEHEYDAEPLEGSEAAAVLKGALGRGVTLGLHPGFKCSGSVVLAAARERLHRSYGVEVTRVRMHYLRLYGPEVFDDMRAAGFTHDGSVGWSRRQGARHGLHVPFRPACGDRLCDIWEMPLLFMDSALTDSGVGGEDTMGAAARHEAVGGPSRRERSNELSPREAIAMGAFLDWTVRVGARGCVLFHNGPATPRRLAWFISECRARSIDLVDMPALAAGTPNA